MEVTPFVGVCGGYLAGDVDVDGEDGDDGDDSVDGGTDGIYSLSVTLNSSSNLTLHHALRRPPRRPLLTTS
ncbi:hypothetical protein VN97_g10515 [Penicillium thymicola]|uniref:Uncharacterized protein n=1 Tax=Penicillium thymicola TaxID=293382 RepID=A0AAI9X4B4_PENTH|nr:hypothetical protein VN97_g10515 [Penicillium thymicola]